jgi:DNA-binding IclR family transcriptional regulator
MQKDVVQEASPSEQREGPAYPIGSVDKALRLLLLFREHPVLRVTDASEELGVVRSTAHRLLAMLQHHGFVVQDPVSKAYRSGPALVDIGLAVVRDMDLRSQLHPYLEQLVAAVGETAQMMVLRGTEILFVDSVESEKALRTSSRVGNTLPAHCTSGGKALLAELDPAAVRRLYAGRRLEKPTPRSIGSREALERELERVRERGYATNVDESEVDISAIAAVVRGRLGQPLASLAISAPTSRLGAAERERAAAHVVRIARAASDALA